MLLKLIESVFVHERRKKRNDKMQDGVLYRKKAVERESSFGPTMEVYFEGRVCLVVR